MFLDNTPFDYTTYTSNILMLNCKYRFLWIIIPFDA
jgi:hypothetical protein